jgi:hypothetical protein
MAVESIVAQRRLSARETAKTRRVDRLRELDAGRMFAVLEFLAGFRPSVFDAVLEAAVPGPGREPFCAECGARAGMFWLLGDEWHHFRPGGGSDAEREVYDPGHVPVIGWRAALAVERSKAA